jgi:hypothetical protein
MNKVFEEHYRMGELTVVQQAAGAWIVMEDDRQVGGTLRHPFPSAAAARRWIERERAGYEEDLARGDHETIATAKVIRQTDPELWARCAAIEQQFRDRSETSAMPRTRRREPIS